MGTIPTKLKQEICAAIVAQHTAKARRCYTNSKSDVLSLCRTLTCLARRLGYSYKRIRGDNGSHFYDYVEDKAIALEVGRDAPAIDRLITLAHELGHALDIIYNPLELSETCRALRSWETYSINKEYYSREISAWRYGKDLFVRLQAYDMLAPRFKTVRRYSLGTYYRRMRKHGVSQSNQG